MCNMNSGIYQIMNKVNNKIYVGSAVDIKQRWNKHKSLLRKKIHANDHLQKAWILYGEDIFQFNVLEKCNKENLIQKEQYYLDLLNPEYNICKIAGNCLGVKHLEETKRKQSLALKDYNNNPEIRQKKSLMMIGENNPIFGAKRSTEVKQKISETRIRLNLSKGENHPLFGKHHSEETKKKISASLKGNRLSEETRQKMSLIKKQFWNEKKRRLNCQLAI